MESQLLFELLPCQLTKIFSKIVGKTKNTLIFHFIFTKNPQNAIEVL